MLKLFTPDYYIHSFSALRPEYLLEHGIRLLVCDIDNTLVPHDVALPDEKAVQFISVTTWRNALKPLRRDCRRTVIRSL